MASDKLTRFRLKMIPIKPCKRNRGDGSLVSWTKSPAFAANVRGILIHRVRHVTTVLWAGEEHHYHVTYLCNNGCNVDLDRIDDVLIADPPKDRLLCQFCENQALRKYLPSADHLAGRHVHRGVLVARRVCCLKEGCES